MIVRRDTFSFKGYAVIYAVFVLVMICGVILGAVGPSNSRILYSTAYNCPDNPESPWAPAPCAGGVSLNRNTTTWVGSLTNLSPLNEELSLSFQIHNTLPFGVNHALLVRLQVHYEDTTSDADAPYSVDVTHTRKVDCAEGADWCEPIYIYTESTTTHKTYMCHVSFLGDQEANQFIGDVLFRFRYRDPTSAIHEIALRYTLIVLTVMLLIWYTASLRKFAWTEMFLEQKWTMFLAIMLFFFNNPFWPLQLFVGRVFQFFNIFFMLTGFCFLMLFWLILLDALRKPDPIMRVYGGFYAPKFVIVGILWIVLLVVFLWQAFSSISDPAYSSPNDQPGFRFFAAMLIIDLCVYVFHTVFVVMRLVTKARKDSSLRRPLTFFLATTIVAGALMVTEFLFTTFSDSQNGAGLRLGLYSAVNGYVWVLMFIFSPSSHSRPGASQREQDAEAGVRRHAGIHTLGEDDEEDLDVDASADRASMDRPAVDPLGDDDGL